MRMRRVGVLSLGALVVGSLLQAPAWPQTGTTFTVTRFDDPVPDGCVPVDCSLREAVIDASAALGTPTIVLPAGTFVLSQVGPETPGTRDLDVTGDMAIIGAGADVTVIDANGAVTNDRVFEIYGLSALQLTGVTAGGGGGGPDGSGIAVRTGSSLTMNGSAVIENKATGAGGGINAGLNSTLVISDSLVARNQTTSVGGGIVSSGTSTLSNATISGNSASGSTGGMLVNAGVATLNNVTITDNLGDSNNSGGEMGGGVLQGFGAVLNLRNSIIAGNRIGSGSSGPDCNGTITSQGGNVVQDTSTCTFTPAAADVTGQPAGLGTLAQNGGPTATHALLPGSPAIDRGGTGCATSDQRGAPRAGACDSGAYEVVLCQTVLVDEVGTEGADVLTGTEGADGVLALGGNDKVSTLGGDDGVCAGSGNDKANGGGGKDRLAGETGKDKLRGQGGNDRLKGGPGKDLCVGGGGKDRAACETEKSV